MLGSEKKENRNVFPLFLSLLFSSSILLDIQYNDTITISYHHYHQEETTRPGSGNQWMDGWLFRRYFYCHHHHYHH